MASLPDLQYNIAESYLKGRIGTFLVHCYAGSGGRAGTKTTGAFNSLLANNVLASHLHHGAHTFGPLPQGLYYLVPHEHDPNMVRLEPFPGNYMFGRAAFLIHGRGKIGSHGCIVPFDFKDVVNICRAVSQEYRQGRKPVLKVIAVGSNLDRKFILGTTTA